MSPSRLAELVQGDFGVGAECDVEPRFIDPRGFLIGKNLLVDNDSVLYKRGGSVAKSAVTHDLWDAGSWPAELGEAGAWDADTWSGEIPATGSWDADTWDGTDTGVVGGADWDADSWDADVWGEAGGDVTGGGEWDEVDSSGVDEWPVDAGSGADEWDASGFSGGSLRWIWDGFLHPGRRTLVAERGRFGVLAPDDTTILNLGPIGLSGPTKARVLDNLLFIGGGQVYGGSRKSAPYLTGTVDVTANSKAVVGIGTAWAANADPGMIFKVGPSRFYVVEAVIDDTHLILTKPYVGPTAVNATYSLRPIAQATPNYPASPYYAVAGNRLLAVELPNKVRFSEINDATHSGPHVFGPNDYHELPDGVEILGLAAIGEEAFIFTSQGLWILSGLAYDLVSLAGGAQQSLSHVSEDLLLWGNAGVASYQGALVCPMLDSIYLIDPRGGETNVGRSIKRAYQHYVNLGYRPGGAIVYQGHYFLPILDQGHNWIDTLVCRLDRPVGGRYTYWPFTQLSGIGAKASCYAVRAPASSGAKPRLLAANNEDGAIMDCTKMLEPNAGNATDHDGTAPEITLVTRDYPTVNGILAGRGRKVELLYEMARVKPADDPRIGCELGLQTIDEEGPRWDEVDWNNFDWAGTALDGFFETLDGTFGVDPGVNRGWWLFSRTLPYVRFRFRSSDPVAKLRILAVVVRTAQPDNNRRTQVPNLASA